jgi:circadian clock protein KaiC
MSSTGKCAIERRKRVSTGCSGLDDILDGGLVRGEFYLLGGSPGSGKTTLALQFLLQGARLGEKVLYITLSESRTALMNLGESHGFDMDTLEIAEVTLQPEELKPDSQYNIFRPADVELVDRMQKVIGEIKRSKPHRVVLDSLSELRMLAGDETQFRRQVLSLKTFLTENNATVLAIDISMHGIDDPMLYATAHGVILLEKIQREYGMIRRRLEIPKVRGTTFREGFHDYLIATGGLLVFPRLVAAESRDEQSVGEPLPSGIPELDQLVGGGLEHGTNTLIAGPAGVGKTTLSTVWMAAAAQRGERACAFLFEEGTSTLLQRAAALGIDLRPHVKKDTIRLNHIDPAEWAPGQFVEEVRRAVEERSARLVLIDSLNGYLQSMPGEEYLNLHLHEMFSYLNNRGVVTLVVLNQEGMIGAGMGSPIDVSYLADNVIAMRYFEANGEIRKALLALKKRGSSHEITIRELNLEPGRVRVGKALDNFRGILTGTPEFMEEDFERRNERVKPQR